MTLEKGTPTNTDKQRVNDFWNEAAWGGNLYLQTTDIIGYVIQSAERYRLAPHPLPHPQPQPQPLSRRSRGAKACAKAFVHAIEAASPAPIPFNEVIEVSRVSIELAWKDR
jgi:hypothetical protein